MLCDVEAVTFLFRYLKAYSYLESRDLWKIKMLGFVYMRKLFGYDYCIIFICI
jgi:hypothetical protein